MYCSNHSGTTTTIRQAYYYHYHYSSLWTWFTVLCGEYAYDIAFQLEESLSRNISELEHPQTWSIMSYGQAATHIESLPLFTCTLIKLWLPNCIHHFEVSHHPGGCPFELHLWCSKYLNREKNVVIFVRHENITDVRWHISMQQQGFPFVQFWNSWQKRLAQKLHPVDTADLAGHNWFFIFKAL